ncbi:MAG: choice-of-anchor Q domain-containing protein [Flavobacterium sp.]
MNQDYRNTRIKFIGAIFFFLMLLGVTEAASAQTIRYVKEGGTGNGASWTDASGDLQLMINNSTSGDQVWVARGTFKPNRKFGSNSISANHQDNTFTLKTGVSVYGSFAGTETAVGERKVEDNPTVLSGDFSSNDTEVNGVQLKDNAYGRTENAYHVVIAYGYSGIFDGFRILGGNAFGTGTIDNSINRKYGGGMYIANSAGVIRNVLVKGSRANNRGGAIYIEQSSTIFINTTLLWCYAGEGGGIYTYNSSARISNSIINSCYAGLNTGGGGAIAVEANYPVLQNCVVYDNYTSGSAGSAFSIKAYSGLHLMNCIAHDNGLGLTKLTGTNSAITFYNSNVQVNGVSGNSGGGNISADPKFVNPSRFDFRLKADSPSINTGKNQYVDDTIDRAGNPRINGDTVDMGPYEYYAVPVRYVKQIASGTGDGSSWANASDDLQLMINNSLPGEQVWVAKGTYKPKRTPTVLSPVTSDNRSNTFLLKSGVWVYGSFEGNETTIEGRNFITNATILSGDLNGDDATVTADKLPNAIMSKNGENVFHVVAGSLLSNVVFDGFTVAGGNASNAQTFSFNGDSFLASVGGGLYIHGETHTNIFRNITITKCNQTQGAFFCIATNAVVSNISVSKCSTTHGVIFNDSCSPFYNNVAILDCYGTAGVAFSGLGGTATVTNALITSNSTAAQGAIIWTLSTEIVDIRNSIIFGNSATKMIYKDGGGVVQFAHSLVQGSGSSQAWDTAFGTNGGGNIDDDPLFTNAANGDFTLQPGSPAINTGNNSFVTSITTDINGNARIYGSAVDMGAYEFSGTSCTTPSAPSAQDQIVCTIANPTIASLTAEGTNLKWYTAATGGTALAAEEEIVTGNYYVSQSNGTCESTRTAVTVTLASDCITLEDPFCNITAPFSKPLYAIYVAGAIKYRFRVTEGNEVHVIERTGRYFYINNIEGFNYSKTYSVAVSYFKDGQWSAYGPACNLSTPVLPVSQLRPEYCGVALSSFTSAIYATSASMTTGYRFRVIQGGNTQIIEKTAGYFKINEITGYTYGKTYTVDVALRINGEWGVYGPDCIVTTSEAVAHLADAYCGITTTNLKTVIYANGILQATGYRFRINDGSTDYVLTRTQRYFLVSQIPGYTYSATYTVNVAALVNGNWTDYGPSCSITTPDAPLTQIAAVQCGAFVPSLATNIKIIAVNRAQGYRLRVTNGVQEQILDRPSASFRLNMLASRAYNTTYTVEIAVKVNGDYGPYGPACTITALNNTSRPGGGELTINAAASKNVAGAITLTSFPNPYTESFTIEMNTQSQDKISIRVFDMNGRLVENLTTAPDELASQKLGRSLASGIYNVVVTQGDYQKAFKVLKK